MSRRAIETVAENRIRQAMEEASSRTCRASASPLPTSMSRTTPSGGSAEWVRRERLGPALAGKIGELLREGK